MLAIHRVIHIITIYSYTVSILLYVCLYIYIIDIIIFLSLLLSHSVMANSLQPYGLQHARFPCPSLTPGVWSNSYKLSRIIYIYLFIYYLHNYMTYLF